MYGLTLRHSLHDATSPFDRQRASGVDRLSSTLPRARDETRERTPARRPPGTSKFKYPNFVLPPGLDPAMLLLGKLKYVVRGGLWPFARLFEEGMWG